jgi:hypothetical protein
MEPPHEEEAEEMDSLPIPDELKKEGDRPYQF